MDYMRQLNGFWNWRRTNQVSHVQADLYFTILACANAARWREKLSIPNSTLEGMCQISRTELHKQRLALIQKGLIRYVKGKKGTSGIYSIIPLYETNAATHTAANTGINPAVNAGINQRNLYKKKTQTQTNTDAHPREASYDMEKFKDALRDMPTFD